MEPSLTALLALHPDPGTLLLHLLGSQRGLHARTAFGVNHLKVHTRLLTTRILITEDAPRRVEESRVWTYVIPVLLGSSWQLLPSLNQKDAGVADVSAADLAQTAETGSVRSTR